MPCLPRRGAELRFQGSVRSCGARQRRPCGRPPLRAYPRRGLGRAGGMVLPCEDVCVPGQAGPRARVSLFRAHPLRQQAPPRPRCRDWVVSVNTVWGSRLETLGFGISIPRFREGDDGPNANQSWFFPSNTPLILNALLRYIPCLQHSTTRHNLRGHLVLPTRGAD